MIGEALALAAAWTLWCVMHSVLAVPAVRLRLERWCPPVGRWYRLGYNLFALVTLVPLVIWLESASGKALLLEWRRPWTLVQAGAWLVALVLFWEGGRVYPLGEFLGLARKPGAEKENRPPLVTTGVLGMVRHPWYLAGLLVLWARDLAPLEALVAAILSLYLVFGALLEERRLHSLYGECYRRYQREVSMFLPLKWLRRRLRGDKI